MRCERQDRTGAPGGGDHEFKIRGQAEQPPPMSRAQKKRKRTSDNNNWRRPEGRRFDSPHTDTGLNREQSGSRTDSAASVKRAKLLRHATTATTTTNTIPRPPSTNPAAPDSVVAAPRPRSNKRQGDKEDKNGDQGRGWPANSKVSRQVTLLERAQQSAAEYPALANQPAWQSLGKETDKKRRQEAAFVYRHLRRSQCPKALSYKEWCKLVHREMERLGLQDVRERKRLVEEVSGKGIPMEEKVLLAETVPVVDEAKYEDDGFDIDIYGDEETRLKYEPWIRSRMGWGRIDVRC